MLDKMGYALQKREKDPVPSKHAVWMPCLVGVHMIPKIACMY